MDKSLIAVAKETLGTLHRHSNLDGKIDPLQKKKNVEILTNYVTFVFTYLMIESRDKKPQFLRLAFALMEHFFKGIVPLRHW